MTSRPDAWPPRHRRAALLGGLVIVAVVFGTTGIPRAYNNLSWSFQPIPPETLTGRILEAREGETPTDFLRRIMPEGKQLLVFDHGSHEEHRPSTGESFRSETIVFAFGYPGETAGTTEARKFRVVMWRVGAIWQFASFAKEQGWRLFFRPPP